jgi:DNA-binding transcriptional MerR regulator
VQADLLGIGEFARRSGLTVKALRYYDRIGLLEPARTSRDTNFRRYRRDQIAPARLIAKLRSVGVPIEEIRLALTNPSGEAVSQILGNHRRRLQARATRLAGDLHRLQHLLTEGADTNMTGNASGESPMLDPEAERRVGADLFNEVWRFLELENRSTEEDDLMVHMAHASAYHWRRVGKAENFARSDWQCSRVYSVLGRAEPALHHAQRCLELCERNGIGDFDLAFAYEALARAHGLAGHAEQARHMTELALAACEHIADPEDKQIVLADLETIAGVRRFW